MKFCVSYVFNGKKYGFNIDADSIKDAEKRCKQLNLTLEGELVREWPATVISNTKKRVKFEVN